MSLPVDEKLLFTLPRRAEVHRHTQTGNDCIQQEAKGSNLQPSTSKLQCMLVVTSFLLRSIVENQKIQYSTVQYSTVQYSTVQYSTVQYSTVQYSTVQYSTVVQYD
jgi:hypothetical protein